CIPLGSITYCRIGGHRSVSFIYQMRIRIGMLPSLKGIPIMRGHLCMVDGCGPSYGGKDGCRVVSDRGS
ncbi:hypothetical protein RCO48_16150, partial [Peribacillus frigoritolerans]|nr:hypothetical protein [Peribacillus frigoritolerans]